jgi:hypothetical protein
MIQSQQQMENLALEWGFLPFFRNRVEGFSIEEHTPEERWFSPEHPGPWDWKGPVIGEWRGMNGAGRIEGVVEANVLYMPADGVSPASAQAELPFAVDVPIPLRESSIVSVQTVSAEASALMGDRLDMKIQLGVRCETRSRREVSIVSGVTEGEPIDRKPGIVLYWPCEGEDAWDIGRRYAIPAEQTQDVAVGKPLVLKV